ncbi:MAG: hypothetical protein JNM18_17130 [Planctomycetaceae bacterium]|nr:hypothetical protein [Planctomycetaceae bacterium]
MIHAAYRRRGLALARAFTLIEVLVATMITLMIVGGLTVMFGNLSENVADSRALASLQNSLRHAKNLLSSDLQGTTAVTMPPLSPEQGLGYFEQIEGPIGPVFYPISKVISRNIVDDAENEFTYPLNDANLPQKLTALASAGGQPQGEDSTLGDVDDILMFTTTSLDTPFIGTGFATSQHASQTAEVIWFVRGNTLYRRVLLVGGVGPGSSQYNYNSLPYSLRMSEFRPTSAFFTRGGQFQPVGNSLGSLTMRENRFGHQPAAFPHDARFWMRITDDTNINMPWVIARPGFMMPILAETDGGGALIWPFPADWATMTDPKAANRNAKFRHIKYVDTFPNSGVSNGLAAAEMVIPNVYYRDLTDTAKHANGLNVYLPVRVDTSVAARRVFDPWARRPLELNVADYSGTGSNSITGYSLANMTTPQAGYDNLTLAQKRSAHTGGIATIRYEGIRQYDDAPRFDDVLMSNVLSFDVKVWDPGAPIFTLKSAGGAGGGLKPASGSELTVFPHDPAYKMVLQRFIQAPATLANGPTSFGAYVDMNYMWGAVENSSNQSNNSRLHSYQAALQQFEQSASIAPSSLPRPLFGGPGQSTSKYVGTGIANKFKTTNWQQYDPSNIPPTNVAPHGYAADLTGALHEAWDSSSVSNTCRNLKQCGLASVYCTWSTHYERNAIDDDRDGIVDNYTNGLDDPGSDPGVDDPSELETVPPYQAPLRGVQITIRAFEPDTRQIREVTITHEFLLE